MQTIKFTAMNLKKAMFIKATHSVIARHWQQTEAPSMAEWACELDRIEFLEHMIACDEDKSDSNKHMWIVWSHFRYFSDFVSFISTKF